MMDARLNTGTRLESPTALGMAGSRLASGTKTASNQNQNVLETERIAGQQRTAENAWR